MVSLGCPKNLVDGEVMLGSSGRRAMTSWPTPARPTIVVNTRFIDRAKQESVDAILEMAAPEQGKAKRLVDA
jgi:ribosomal protein S12 methylthiotransferase